MIVCVRVTMKGRCSALSQRLALFDRGSILSCRPFTNDKKERQTYGVRGAGLSRYRRGIRFGETTKSPSNVSGGEKNDYRCCGPLYIAGWRRPPPARAWFPIFLHLFSSVAPAHETSNGEHGVLRSAVYNKSAGVLGGEIRLYSRIRLVGVTSCKALSRHPLCDVEMSLRSMHPAANPPACTPAPTISLRCTANASSAYLGRRLCRTPSRP